MIAEGSNFLDFSAIALILVLLAARMAKKRDGGFFKFFRRGSRRTDKGVIGRIFESQHLLAFKECPKCAEQLALSTLICDACEYNFLSGTTGTRNKMLPSSELLPGEVSKQVFAQHA